jgi:hydroxypyruvate isomerase
MLKFAANLSFLYKELDFLSRFGAAAADGFRGVEFLFPYSHPAEELAARLQEHGLEQALFNCPPGDWEHGERGMAILPGREAECLRGVELALQYARVLRCPRLHLLAGVVPAGVPRARLRETYVANLRKASDLAAESNVRILIEPLNPRDMPGYFLSTQAEAEEILAEVDRPNVGVQMDLYHCQIVEGDVSTKIRRHFPRIGHIQIAGVPERHEPDIGEVNYSYLFALLETLGYSGWIGCEYRPRGDTTAGLGWLHRYRTRVPRDATSS